MRLWPWIFSYIRQVRGVFAAALLLLVVSVLSNLGIVYMQKLFIDDVIAQRRLGDLPVLLAAFVGVVCLYIASWCFKDIWFERASDRLRLLMRRDYMRQLYRMPMAEYRNERLGGFAAQINAFIQSKDVYIRNMPALLEKSLHMALLLGIIGYALPSMLLVLLPLGALYIAQGRYFGPRLQRLSGEQNEALAAHRTAVEEGVSSTREVVAFDQTAWERAKLSRSFRRYAELVQRANRLERGQIAMSEPLRWAANIAVLGFGGYQVVQGRLSVGWFVVFYQYAIQLIDAMHGVYRSALVFASAHGGLSRAKALLDGERIADVGADADADAGAGGNAPAPDEPIGAIRFERVGFSYSPGLNPVLAGLSLTIPAGCKTAIVGDSGSGKSTLAQLLVRFCEPAAGAIFAGERPIAGIARADWSKRVAVVFQEPYLFPDTLRNNVLLGRAASEDELREACRLADIEGFLAELPLGFDTVLGERGVTLSGGQRQRVAIARALIGRPEVLILDEASSALDTETERRIHRNLDAARQGMTTIVIAHRLSTVQNADLIAVMADGAIADAGTHAELLGRAGRYAELYRAGAS